MSAAGQSQQAPSFVAVTSIEPPAAGASEGAPSLAKRAKKAAQPQVDAGAPRTAGKSTTTQGGVLEFLESRGTFLFPCAPIFVLKGVPSCCPWVTGFLPEKAKVFPCSLNGCLWLARLSRAFSKVRVQEILQNVERTWER
jgi:hypothetical protein